MPTNSERFIRRDLTTAVSRLIDRYLKGKHIDIYDLQRYFKRRGAITELIKDLKGQNIHLFNSDLEYRNKVREILSEVLQDRISELKDKDDSNKNKNENMKNIICFSDYLNENIINESNLPTIKLGDITNKLPTVLTDHRKALSTFYKTYIEYIDITDKQKHLFKINDMSGDIMGNNRVTFDVLILHDSELKTVKDNIVYYAIGDFYTALPEMLNIFGVELKPVSLIDKDGLKSVFNNLMTIDKVMQILVDITHYKYQGQFGEFHIWNNK